VYPARVNGPGDYDKFAEFDLDGERYDRPSAGGPAPGRAYVICSTQRSGSWLLCRLLYNAGIGVPSEYFNAKHLAALCARWGLDPQDTRAYLRALHARRTTANGAWGTKLQWPQYTFRRSGLRNGLLRDARLVHLVRDDVVPQAVSLHLSHITGIWGFDGAVSTAPQPHVAIGDPAHLAACERTIVDENREWRRLFASTGVEPLALRYEDVVADQPGAVERVARWLGLAPGEYRVPPPEPRDVPFPPALEERRRALVAQWRDAPARAASAA
jgi:LPS sulfotransferase NodH